MSSCYKMLLLVGILLISQRAFAETLGPTALVASVDSKRLYVANSDAKQIAIIDPRDEKRISTIQMPAEPTGLALTTDGRKLYVTCAVPKSTICTIDTQSLKITGTLPAGHTAMSPVLSANEQRLYVCNRFDNNVSVIDLARGTEIARVPMIREPFAAVATADGKSVFVINHLPLDRADSYDVAANVSVIDTASNRVTHIRLPNGSTSLRGLCASPDGKYVYVTHILARYQMPATQLDRGWMNTNALTIIDAVGKKLITTLLLDDIDQGAANPWGVACSPNGQTVCVAHAGTNEISVINMKGVFKKLAKIAAAEKTADAFPQLADVPNDLSFLADLRKRVNLDGVGPRGLIVSRNTVIAAEYFSDSLAIVDLPNKPARSLPLGPRPSLTIERRGEILFNDARICFQHWQSCATCHPDARMDALNWDLMNDGLGTPKNSKSLLLAHQTPPSMWTGIRPNAEAGVRSGLIHILFAVRPEKEACELDEYLKSLKPVPSPHLVDGQLNLSARRGKQLFFDESVGCAECHSPPHYTDQHLHDVGTAVPDDHRRTFVTPSLIECWRTAPYLHNGHYTRIKEMFVPGQDKRHGNIEKLTKQQIEDLVEFVLSL